MDSPPECVLSASGERPPSPSTLPSLDPSPPPSSLLPSSPLALEPSPASPDTTPYFPLSPFTNHRHPGADEEDEEEEEEEEEDLDGAPPSPTPAVALFPGGGGGGPEADPSPPATPPAPLLGFGALELALSSGQGGSGNDELDLQLFQKDTLTRATPGAGGASAGPALRFPCHVCGKRFRFQSILSLHARAHSLDRHRRSSALYRAGLPAAPLKHNLKLPHNHKDLNQIGRKHPAQRPPPGALVQHLSEDEERDGEARCLEEEPNANQLLDGSTALTPPLTEEPPAAASPYSSLPSAAAAAAASTFRCHACKGKFRTASELARHVRILHNPYKCGLCPFSASQEESLASHLQECHPSPDLPALPPAFASRAVAAAAPDTPLPTPTRTPAPPPTAPQTASASAALPAFRCDTCGQRFTQSWFLKGHMRKHKDSLDHKCQVCGRGFKEPWFLKNHMKVHLNKLGLKAGLGGPGGAEQQAKSSGNSQSLNALYSSLLLAQRGAGRGGPGRSEREGGARMGAASGKSAILGYLGLPGDGGGASCMERLQAVAQVAEMGNGGGGDQGRGGTPRGGTTSETTVGVSEGGDQAAWWQLVARSLAVAQQQQQQQQQQRPPHQRGHQHSPRSQGRSSVIAEAYLGGPDPREESGGAGGSWECPDCGKLFRSLQQVVVHARVHTHKPQKGAGGGEEEGSSNRRGAGPGRGGSGDAQSNPNQSAGEPRQEAKGQSAGPPQAGAAAGFHSLISSFKGENGVAGLPSAPPAPSRERVRGRGIKDCPYCGKAFRSSHHLKVHLRVHTGERPYKCPHCDYAGTQSGSLKYHLQRHHREQRGGMSGSSNSSAPGPPSGINSPTSGINSPTSGSGGLAKQRRSQLQHAAGGPVPPEASGSRPGQPSWLLGLPEQREHRKALAALRDIDLESQYRYLSGVMGALYQGGMEGGWIRESPPPKATKVSRRKPLTTSRMVQPSGEKQGSASSTHGGGFEPLDLSRPAPPRPSSSLGGMEEEGGYGGGDVEDDSSGGIKLSQCSDCPFRTSSAELMAMHLQVNHTSKSRRKRGSSSAVDEDGAPRSAKPRGDPELNSIWRHVSEVESQASLREWSQARSLNGLSQDAAEHLEDEANHTDSDLASLSLSDSLVLHGRMDGDEEERDGDFEENMESSGPEDSPGPDQDLKMSLSLSPGLSSNHMGGEEERV